MNENIINEIAETLEMVSDDVQYVYDTETGEIICILKYDITEDEAEAFEEDRYLYLPTQYEIDEYSIMDEFAYQYSNPFISTALREALYGKGASRRFKDTIFRLGIRDEWFDYRAKRYRKIAEEWCIDNGLIEPKKKEVLLTAFKGTSSEKLINQFDDTYHKLILANDKIKSVNQLISELETNEYDYIISFGQKPVIKDKVYVEISGKLENIVYNTNFQITEFVKRLMNYDFAVHISSNAGTSFCNNIYAHGLKYIIERLYEGEMVFVHIPFEKNISDFEDFSNRIILSLNEFVEN